MRRPPPSEPSSATSLELSAVSHKGTLPWPTWNTMQEQVLSSSHSAWHVCGVCPEMGSESSSEPYPLQVL